MALTYEHYLAVNTKLQHLHQYLEALADELNVATSVLDKYSHTHRAAVKAAVQTKDQAHTQAYPSLSFLASRMKNVGVYARLTAANVADNTIAPGLGGRPAPRRALYPGRYPLQ
jgi:galactose-1-phosphate uridylyltransferase